METVLTASNDSAPKENLFNGIALFLTILCISLGAWNFTISSNLNFPSLDGLAKRIASGIVFSDAPKEVVAEVDLEPVTVVAEKPRASFACMNREGFNPLALFHREQRKARWEAPGSLNEYIRRYQAVCINEMRRSGVLASVKMAQGILESRAGRSGLTITQGNNFGIRYGKSTRNHYLVVGPGDKKWNDAGESAAFCSYADPAHSFIHHTDYLQTRRYRWLYTVEDFNYRTFSAGLKACGYATDPNYHKKLVDIIEENELWRLDQMVYDNPEWFAEFLDALKQYEGDEPIASSHYSNFERYYSQLL
jgi:flagellum-specific peptidoglycan hydrolase FlgJ